MDIVLIGVVTLEIATEAGMSGFLPRNAGRRNPTYLASGLWDSLGTYTSHKPISSGGWSA